MFWAAQGKILKIGTDLGSLEFYEQPCANNPSSYMFCFPTPYDPVAGSAPELIMRIKTDEIFVASIAGTRSGGANAKASATPILSATRGPNASY